MINRESLRIGDKITVDSKGNIINGNGIDITINKRKDGNDSLFGGYYIMFGVSKCGKVWSSDYILKKPFK